MAQNAEQCRLNTDMYIEIMNIIKQEKEEKRKCAYQNS